MRGAGRGTSSSSTDLEQLTPHLTAGTHSAPAAGGRRWLAHGLAAAVRSYQLAVSPLLRGGCRFEPSCSAYAHEALLTHGAGRALALAGWRLLRCQPFATAGWDPVPEPRRARETPGSTVTAGEVGTLS